MADIQQVRGFEILDSRGNLNAAWQKARKGSDVASRLDVQGMNHVSFDTPEAFAAFQRTEVDRWSKIITRAGVKPE